MEISEILDLAKKINSDGCQGEELVSLMNQYVDLVEPLIEKYSIDAPEGDDAKLFQELAVEHLAVIDKLAGLQDSTSTMLRHTKKRAKAMKAYTFVNGVAAGMYGTKKG